MGCGENTQPGLIPGAQHCEGQQCVKRSSEGTEASMGLLSGDTLGPLAVALAIFLLLVDLMHRRTRWAPRYPPGPLPLPGLGNLLQVDFQDLPHCINRLRRRFGDVFSVQMAWTPVVVLNGLAAVREALVDRGEDTSDRPPMPLTELLGFGPRSQGKLGRGTRGEGPGPAGTGSPGGSRRGADRTDRECWAQGTEEGEGSRAGAEVRRGRTWPDANVGGFRSKSRERPYHR
ncbi:Cytochrome P450 2D6 [Manis pentadactyla]|nr:Cytochrome P450 2D6 [Manis pentadactyla]